jgi:Zn-dependent protease
MSMSDTLSKLLIVLPIVLVSMSVHEMMHAFTSHWLGDDTAYLQGRVSLNPLRHIDPFFTVALPLLAVLTFGTPFGAAKPVQVNFHRLKFGEFGGAIVGMVGPLTNLLLAVIAALIFRHLNIGSETEFKIFAYMVAVNIGFFVFNTIPWPPLDGSRLLYAFAPRPLQGYMESIERLGANGLIIFMLLVFTVLSVPISNIIIHLSNALLGIAVF